MSVADAASSAGALGKRLRRRLGQLLGLEEMPAPPGKDSLREAWIADLSHYLRLLSDQEPRIALRAIKMMHRTLRDLEQTSGTAAARLAKPTR